MRRLIPAPVTDIAPAAAYRTDDRTPPAGRPWVLANMIISADGATHAGGVSGALSGPADKAVFAALRAVADVILVGASTVRAEGYGPPRIDEATQAEREALGQAAVPTIAVVSGRLDLDWTTPMFTQSPTTPIVITGPGADPDRLKAARRVADVVLTEGAGSGRADLGEALEIMGERGVSLVTCEGGPTLNGVLIDAGLLDELCLTVSPAFVGGSSPRVAAGTGPGRIQTMRLAHLLEADGMLFTRYVRS